MRYSTPATKLTWSSPSPIARRRERQLTAPAVNKLHWPPAFLLPSLKNPWQREFRSQLEAIAPGAIVVVAYGRIIPPWMLALPGSGASTCTRLCFPNTVARLHSVGRGHGRCVHRKHHHAP